jgi:threonine dehydratase
VISKRVERIVTVSEEAIIRAMRHVWERMKIIIEPSSAVAVAVVLDGELDVSDKRVGIIISGGNVDLGRLPW